MEQIETMLAARRTSCRNAAAVVLLVAFSCFAVPASQPQTFSDVPTDHWAYEFIESLSSSGVTSGCGGGNYCPEQLVTRAQMAVFLERGLRGSDYSPPPASGNLFLDVSSTAFAASYIEQLFTDGITGGCGGNNYCPGDPVTRAQMAIFLLRAAHGSGYVPPSATGQDFSDVDSGYWAAAWIEQLAEDGVTSGCGGGNYCPDSPVTRAQMAVFLVRVFGLDSLVQVAYVLDHARAAGNTFDKNGGQINTITESGIGISMLVPSGTVFSDADFGITPVSSVTGLPPGFEPVVAARFSPSDRPFAAIPRITFDLPAGFRDGAIAVGYFTNDSGTQFYLTPLIGPDGRFADGNEDQITLAKNSFSTGGIALIEDILDQDQDRAIGNAQKHATEEITKIINEVVAGGSGGITESDQFHLETILTDWQSDIIRRLQLIESRIEIGSFSDADLIEGIRLMGENALLAEWAQSVGLEEDFLAEDLLDRLSGVIVDAIAASYALCNSTDDEQLDNSGIARARLIQALQMFGRSGVVSGNGGGSIDVDDITEELLSCRFQVEFAPPFTRLPDNETAAVVTMTGRAYNPVTDTFLPTTQGITFQTLGDYQVDPTDNVSLGVISGNTLRFLVSDDEVGTVAISGGRVLAPASVSAQLVPDLSGDYTLSYQGSASNCTDPEDNGPGSGSFNITMASSVTSINEASSTHQLSGAANGGSLQFSLTETAQQVSAPVLGGSANYNESETEEVVIDDETILCTYTTTGSAQLGGTAQITDNTVTIDLTPTNIQSSYTGSPAVCGNGSCSIQGTITLMKLTPP